LFIGGASLMAAATGYLQMLGYGCLLLGLVVFLVVMCMLRKQDIAERQAAPAVLTLSAPADQAEVHIPRRTAEQAEDNRREHIVDRFGLVQADGGIRSYVRLEVDVLTLAERQKLFMIAPDMRDWWRGKRTGAHSWPLFRLRARLWLSVVEIDGLDEEKQRELWEKVPEALDWYMRDKKF